MTDQKKIRNIIYRVCGIGMLASFLILLLPKFYIQVWLTETFALFFFGISWLTKSEAYRWLAADPKGVK
jgi:predicted membrane channel-forming protein YqfA (hemolysin III family)